MAERTHCPQGHPYSGENLRIAADGGRVCRICRRASAKARRLRQYRPPTRATPEERFWAKVDKNGPIRKRSLGRCWIWTAGVNHNGYGTFKPAATMCKAHRYAYELLVGPISPKLELDHLCRNPECVRPTHLEVVTHAENMRRGWAARGSQKNLRCPKGHDLTDESSVYRYRRDRKCRLCRDGLVGGQLPA